jgi:lysophospholipase L1-like esterase
MWLGDSHTAADFMTDEVRKALRARAPMGGPGYVRLGLDGYRHSEVRVTSSGRFRHVPRLPAQRTRVIDGIFGYGGIRTVPQAGASVRATLSSTYHGLVRWTLSYRLPQHAAVTVQLGPQKIDLKAASTDAHASQAILYRELEGDAAQEFVLKHVAGEPEIFGVFVETLMPGVVLDTVGINGARAATVLAWEPAHFAEAVRLRSVDLLVLAFGTNEIFDNAKPDRYEAHVREIVENVREVMPKLPCWIVGPPDASTDDGRSRVRVAEVTAVQLRAAQGLGCAFSSGYELMGGEGSFARWLTHRPPWARGDRIHLTVAGYQELGRLLGHQLLGDGVVSSQPSAP